MPTAARLSCPATGCAAWRRSSRAHRTLTAGAIGPVDTGAGVKTLELLQREGERYTFRAAMGAPEELRQVEIPSPARRSPPPCCAWATRSASSSVRCPTPNAFNRSDRALDARDVSGRHQRGVRARRGAGPRRILIWERGVGPTTSSGTGSSASAVAAAAHGGARAIGRRRRARWHAARRMARGRRLSDRLGRDRPGRAAAIVF